MHPMICIFDIETIPDVKLLRQMYPQENLNNLELCEKAFLTQKEKSGSEFLPLHLHKIVAISSVIADEYGRFLKVGNFGKNDNEQSIISDFLAFVDKKNPKLVSYNGRNFDIPTIMLRAMRYNLQSLAYYEQDNPTFNKNKWENYRQRYSERFHTDLLDSLGHYGSVRGIRLDDVACMCGLPGKYDVSGGDVYEIYYKEKNLAKIDEYCESDVLNTYWVYLKYEILKGNMRIEDYVGILQDWREKIPQNKGYSSIFCDAITKEIQKCSI